MRRYRLLAVALGGVVLVLVGVLLFGNLNRNLVYYLRPGEAVAQRANFDDGQRFRLAGLVAEDSLVRRGATLQFLVVSPGGQGPSVPVRFTGAPAQLFQPGIAVVLEGSWRSGEFVSDTMMVKHDETYAPPAPDAASGA